MYFLNDIKQPNRALLYINNIIFYLYIKCLCVNSDSHVAMPDTDGYVTK